MMADLLEVDRTAFDPPLVSLAENGVEGFFEIQVGNGDANIENERLLHLLDWVIGIIALLKDWSVGK
jgi:hypothetical protein